jgi:hypothetical protein
MFKPPFKHLEHLCRKRWRAKRREWGEKEEEGKGLGPHHAFQGYAPKDLKNCHEGPFHKGSQERHPKEQAFTTWTFENTTDPNYSQRSSGVPKDLNIFLP